MLAFLDWKSKWWRSQASLRKVEPGLREGLKAYAFVQADLQDMLANDFRSLWKKPLEENEGMQDGGTEDDGEGDEDEGNEGNEGNSMYSFGDESEDDD